MGLLSLEKRFRGNLINVHKCLMGGCKQRRSQTCLSGSVVPCKSTRGKKKKKNNTLKHCKFHVNAVKQFFKLQRQSNTEQIAQRLQSICFGDNQNFTAVSCPFPPALQLMPPAGSQGYFWKQAEQICGNMDRTSQLSSTTIR